MRNFLFLNGAQRFGDLALLVLRLFVGVFLVWGVWDNVTNPARMREFEAFLSSHGFLAPAVLAPLSVYVQLLVGTGFVLGLFTRWAGVLCALNFAVAIVMVDHHGGLRSVFPAGCLVVIGLYLATHGAGRLSMDAALRANELPRARSAGVRLKK